MLSFHQFVKNLMPMDYGISIKDREKAKGCQVIMPSTVFFINDHIDFIAECDNDYRLRVKNTDNNMLTLR